MIKSNHIQLVLLQKEYMTSFVCIQVYFFMNIEMDYEDKYENSSLLFTELDLSVVPHSESRSDCQLSELDSEDVDGSSS